MNKKISPNRAKKEKIVASLAEKLAKSKGLVFTNYQGLTHKQLESLKTAIKKLNADLVITKNTLLKFSLLNSKSEALNSKQIQNSDDKNTNLNNVSDFEFRISNNQNTTATLFLYGDPVLPLKEIAKAIKEFNLPQIKFGILDGKALTSDELIKISTLPSREVLLAQLVGGLKSPIFGLHKALNWNIQKLALTLSAIQQKKS